MVKKYIYWNLCQCRKKWKLALGLVTVPQMNILAAKGSTSTTDDTSTPKSSVCTSDISSTCSTVISLNLHSVFLMQGFSRKVCMFCCDTVTNHFLITIKPGFLIAIMSSIVCHCFIAHELDPWFRIVSETRDLTGSGYTYDSNASTWCSFYFQLKSNLNPKISSCTDTLASNIH